MINQLSPSVVVTENMPNPELPMYNEKRFLILLTVQIVYPAWDFLPTQPPLHVFFFQLILKIAFLC